MRTDLSRRFLAPAACAALALAPAPVAAQTANSPPSPPAQASSPSPAATAVPAVEVTAPSPIVRPKAKQSATQPPVQSATATPKPVPAPAATAAEPLPQLAGTTVAPVTDAFVPVTVVTDREILANPGPSIADSLSSKPGITASAFSPGSSRPVIRGLDTYRIRIQENGIGSHDVSALSEDHAVPIDPTAAGQVEVIRGPATLRYGSQGIGGVVAVENGRIPTAIPRNGGRGEVKGGYGSVDNSGDGAFSVTAGAGGIALHADGFRRRASDYATPHGRQLNSFVDAEGLSFGGAVIWSSGYIGAAWSRYQSLYGIPGEEAAEERPRIDLVQDKVTAKAEWRVGDMGVEAIRAWFGGTRYAHNEVVFEAAEGIDIIGTRFTNREYEARGEVQHQAFATPVGILRGAAGVQWGHKRQAGFGVGEPVDGLLDPAARGRHFAGFLFEELDLKGALQGIRLQAAGRVEDNRSEGTGVADPLIAVDPVAFSRSYTPVSGSFGILFDLPLAAVARVTLQHTERAPDLGELYSKGVHEATGTFEIGNPNLSIEKADTIEAGIGRSIGRFRFDTSVFHTRYDGFIFKSFTGRQCDDELASCGAGTELDELVFAQRNARFTGLEVAGEIDVADVGRGVLGLSGQYDYVRAQFDGGDNVPRITPQRVGAGIYYRDPNWAMKLWTLTALRQDDVSALDVRDTPTNGYTLLNAEVGYTFKAETGGALATTTTVGIRGENLLDDDVRNHVSFKKDEVLQPGRTVRLFGSIRFD